MSGAIRTNTCSRCREALPVDLFHIDPRYTSGYGSWCKPCINARKKERRQQRRQQRDDEKRARQAALTAMRVSCHFDGCGRLATRSNMTLCTEHGKMKSSGKPLRPLLRANKEKTGNNIIIEGDVARIELTDKHDRCRVSAVISVEDITVIAGRRWCLSSQGYVVSGRPHVKMHRLIMAACPDAIVDHINGIRHDNRRENLRLVDNKQHAQNVAGRGRLRGVCMLSEFTGVPRKDGTRCRRIRRWAASVMVQGVRYKSKTCFTMDEAVEEARELRRKYCTHAVESRHE